jgi:hypothetical protein
MSDRPNTTRALTISYTRSYRQIRPTLDAASVGEIVRSDPELVEDWLRFSADKRTKGGWAFYPGGDGWIVSEPFPEAGPIVTRRHSDEAAACADYILTELDFWTEVGNRRTLA